MERKKRAHSYSGLELALVLLLTLAAFLSLPKNLAAFNVQDKEAQAESLLAEADDFYAKGDYQKAIQYYLQAAQIAEKKLSLSRAHMGLSVSCYFLNETENAKKYIKKVLEIDPQKEVSGLFYPQAYVELFTEVKKDMEQRGALKPVVAPGEEEKQEEVPRAEEQAPAAEGLLPEEKWEGRFEIEVHVSGWSIDPAKSAFEDDLTSRVANEVRDSVTDRLNATYHGSLIRSSHEHSLSLDSAGSNYGVEIRYYPLGRRGSMSLGLSFERTNIRIPVKGQVIQRYSNGGVATVDVDAFVKTNPVTTNLSFRWDIVHFWRVTPYFVFGLGFGPLAGDANYTYVGTYQRGSSQQAIEGGEDKTFDDLREEGEIDLDLFILLHTALGVKGDVYKNFSVKAEVGFWDGLIFRGGLAFRF